MQDIKILEILSSWNFWGQGLDTGIKRKYTRKIIDFLTSGTNKIISIYGIRRSGKSYILRQVAKELSKKYGKENVLYVNFEEASFPSKLNKEFLSKIYDIYLNYIKPNKKPFLLLDEVQEVEEWEKWVRSLNEQDKARIVVTGSSAKLMSEELETLLAGRTIAKEIFPLSFEEYLEFKKLKPTSFLDIVKNKDKIMKLMLEYLEFGGFPEVVLEDNYEKKLEIVRNYFQSIIIKDVIKRFSIKNIKELEALAKFIISNPCSYLSFRKLEKYLAISVKTIEKYCKYLNIARLYFDLYRFSFSVRKQIISPKKIYLSDVSFFTSSGFRFSENLGPLMENIVFLELLRKKNEQALMEIYYYKDNGYEIDFLIKKGPEVKELIQVTYASSFDEIAPREYRALIKASELFKQAKLTIVTWDYEDQKALEWWGRKAKIDFVPLWKWLLKV